MTGMRSSGARSMAVLGAVVTLIGCGGKGGAAPSPDRPPAADLPTRYVLPGDRAFPEGIGAQKSTGDFFVSGATDGAIYRGNLRRPTLEVFLPGGRDGRTGATAVRVRDGRLWVAGRYTGELFVYDIDTRRLLRTYRVPEGGKTFSPRRERSLLSGVTFAGDAVYVTDAYQPVIHRISLERGRLGELEPWIDLRGTPVAYGRGANLKGISVSDGEGFLVTVNSRTGELFRIDVRTRAIRRIDLGGADVRTGDGLLLDGTTLLVVRPEPGEIQPVYLSSDLLRGELGEPFGRSRLRSPTSMFELDGRGIVVNSRRDRPGDPESPFTVAAVPIPEGTLPRR